MTQRIVAGFACFLLFVSCGCTPSIRGIVSRAQSSGAGFAAHAADRSAEPSGDSLVLLRELSINGAAFRPLADSAEVFIADKSGRLYCYAYPDFTEAGMAKFNAPLTAPPARIGDILLIPVLLASGQSKLILYNIREGKTEHSVTLSGRVAAPVSVYEGKFLCAAEAGDVYSVSLEGEISLLLRMGVFTHSPVLAGGGQFFTADDRGNACFFSGDTDKAFRTIHLSDSPVLAGGYVGGVYIFYSRDGHIYAVGSDSLVWSRSVGGRVQDGVTARGAVIYAAAADGNITAYNGATGEVLWSSTIRDAFYYPPLVFDGKIFLAGASGKMYFLHRETGAIVFSADEGLPPLADAVRSGRHIIGGAGQGKVKVYEIR